jgi:FkbM family methyltransferase
MINFIDKLERVIGSAIWNNYKDNHDHYRFGPFIGSPAESKFMWASNAVKLILKGRRRIIAESALAPYVERLSRFYHLLADDQSRDLLVQLVAYRILGKNKVKLPLNTTKYWQGIVLMKTCIKDLNDIIHIDFKDWQLNRFNLQSFGIPVDIYLTIEGIFTAFMLRQYEYRKNGISIGIKAGDTVIDAGACWGETALLFSLQAGTAGQVHSFEFLPSNLEILRCNLLLNQKLAQRINLVEKPLWDISGKALYYSEKGPGSEVSFDRKSGSSGKVESVSIDNYVHQNSIRKIDFIKMDIEGAEQYALNGALNTICQFRPQLAIAIYHNLDDFCGMADLINSMGLGYRFYLGHFSIHTEETVLYAS